MTPDKWRRAEALFHESMEVSADRRAEWLAEVCQGDEELRAEVVSLLECDAAAGDAFVAEQIEPVAAEFFARQNQRKGPARVGPYRVLSELGRGGMGTVYLAERDDHYHTQVAIKLVRRGMDTDLILHRFFRERQTLARLQHPNIARLLDGGATQDGDPYIVMEYVDGKRITDYCRERKLTIRQRLTLFLDVCKAVEYAHRQFVVHRDLKPGNILVDQSGEVKLLDFGICKLLQQDEREGLATTGVMPAYTPNYASPEQIRAEPVTVASDVYSAATVLYELLTESTPHRITDFTPRGIERSICEEETLRPSAAAAERGWAKQLAGDLDNILLHALAKEPARRYETVEQFADDIRRYLTHEPVRAQPGTWVYRTRKFIQRRSGLVVATAAVLLTMAAGVAASWRSARIANENLGMVRKLSNTFVFDVYDSVKDLPGSTQARELIVKTGLEYLDNLSRNASGNTELQIELAVAYSRIGDVQGYVMTANLGKTSEAMRSYEKAVGLLRAAARDRKHSRDARLEEIRVLRKAGGILEYTKEPAQALARYRDARKLAEALKSDYPSDIPVRTLWAGLHLPEAVVLRRSNDFRVARDLYETALAELEKLQSEKSGDAEIEGNRIAAISGRAVCDVRLGRLRDALEAYRKGLAWRQQQLAKQPDSVSLRRGLMFEYSHMGDVLGNPNLPNLGDRAGAVDAYRQMAELARQLHEGDPKDQRGRSDYAIALTRVSAVLPDTATAERIHVLRQSIQLQREVDKVTPDNLMNRADLVFNHNFLGDALEANGEPDKARGAYQEGIRLGETMVANAQGTLLTAVALLYRKLGILHARGGEREAALRCARRVMSLAVGEKETSKRPADFQRFFEVRGPTAMGLIHAALAGSRAANAQDAAEAKRWLNQSLAKYDELSKLPSFSSTRKREVEVIRKALESLK